MTAKSKKRTIRILLAMMLVLGIIAVSVFTAPEAGASEKTLSVDTGHYVRWRRGLPPEDDQWHRILLISTNFADYVMRGNTLVDGLGAYGVQNEDLLVNESDGAVENVIPGFDYRKDVNYTTSYFNTPAARFAKYDNKNNHDSAPPMYYIRLSDWDGKDGNLTDIGAYIDNTGNAYFTNDITVPYAFVTAEHDDDVDEGRVVIEKFVQGGIFQSWHWSASVGEAGSDSRRYGVELTMWTNAREFIIYHGDEIAIDTVSDGQVIEDGEIVNISGGNYLTLDAGSTLTIRDGGILSIGSGFYNDGTIRVEKGGTLIIRENAFLMPWQTDSGHGNVICDGGDVIVYSGGKLVCEGASGFKFAGKNSNYGTVYNYGLIMTLNLTLRGKARSVHNEGSILVGWVIDPKSAQTFQDAKISPKGTDPKTINTIPGLKTKGHITCDIGTNVITGYTSSLIY